MRIGQSLTCRGGGCNQKRQYLWSCLKLTWILGTRAILVVDFCRKMQYLYDIRHHPREQDYIAGRFHACGRCGSRHFSLITSFFYYRTNQPDRPSLRRMIWQFDTRLTNKGFCSQLNSFKEDIPNPCNRLEQS
jgi:hypothetical protein